MIPGDTIASGRPNVCSGDRPYWVHEPYPLTNQVLSTPAGYYVGTLCQYCGPYSRESGYYRSRDEAQQALDSGAFER